MMRNIFVLGVSCAIALGMAELALTMIVPRGPHPWPPGLEAVFTPDPTVMPGVQGESLFKINSHGLRGDDASAKVLAIGGSTTECVYLDQQEAWPQLVQQSLGVTVGNAGKSGLTSRHHVVQVEALLEAHPDVQVVTILAGVNDLTRRLSADLDYLPADLGDLATRTSLIRESFAAHPGSDAEQPAYKRTEVWRLMRKLRSVRAEPPKFQDAAGRIYATWREHRLAATGLRDRLPPLEEALEEYSSNLHTLVDLIERHGAKPLLMTQPSMWRSQLDPGLESLLWLGGVGNFQSAPGHEYYTIEMLAEAMALYNAVVLQVCKDRGIGCIDLASLIPKDDTSFYDDVHFNEAGSRLVAKAVTEHVAALLN